MIRGQEQLVIERSKMLDNDTEIFARLVICGNTALLSQNMDISIERIEETIGKLEKKEGIVLVDRSKDRITLTSAGQKYYEDIISLIEKEIDDMSL